MFISKSSSQALRKREEKKEEEEEEEEEGGGGGGGEEPHTVKPLTLLTFYISPLSLPITHRTPHFRLVANLLSLPQKIEYCDDPSNVGCCFSWRRIRILRICPRDSLQC